MSVKDVRDWYRVRPGYWFRPKYFGFGATPVTWQGWLAVAVMLAVTVPVAVYAGRHYPAYIVLVAPLVALFTWICRLKTDGEWRWRSGGDA
jgi:hypothetical protein